MKVFFVIIYIFLNWMNQIDIFMNLIIINWSKDEIVRIKESRQGNFFLKVLKKILIHL